MGEFLKPSWWISVVIAGLLVNLASAYLKPRVDGVMLRSSAWWRSKSAARIAKRASLVAAIRATGKMNTAWRHAIDRRLQGIEWLATGVALFAVRELLQELAQEVVGIIALIFAALCFTFGLNESRRADSQIEMIDEAEALDARDSDPRSSVPPT